MGLSSQQEYGCVVFQYPVMQLELGGTHRTSRAHFDKGNGEVRGHPLLFPLSRGHAKCSYQLPISAWWRPVYVRADIKEGWTDGLLGAVRERIYEIE